MRLCVEVPGHLNGSVLLQEVLVHMLACLHVMLALIFRPVLGSQQAHSELPFINLTIFCYLYFETIKQIILKDQKNPKETAFLLSTNITTVEKITG